MGNKSALQLEVEKEMGFEIDEDLFAYLEHYARRKLEVANKSAGRAWGEDGYCHPYSSYERGSNENVNRMIRRWFPKGTDFRKVTAKAIQKVEDWINNYPREILGFRTAEAVFQEGLACLT